MRKDKDDHSIVIKGAVNQERHYCSEHICPEHRCTQFHKALLKSQVYPSTVAVGDLFFSAHGTFFKIDHTLGHKVLTM